MPAESETPKIEEPEEKPILSDSGAFANIIDAGKISAAQQESNSGQTEPS